MHSDASASNSRVTVVTATASSCRSTAPTTTGWKTVDHDVCFWCTRTMRPASSWSSGSVISHQLTVHHKRTMYLLEPTEEAKAAARKRVTVVEYEDGRVSIRFQGVALAARPFHKDGCVTQGSIVENKLRSGALTEIRKRQQEKALVQSAKTRREKRIVRRRFAGSLGP